MVEVARDERLEGLGFEELPCVAMVERGGWIVRRNALARRLMGCGAGEEPGRLEQVLLGASGLDGAGRRETFEGMAVRRVGAPLAVVGVAQRMESEDCRLLLMLERGGDAAERSRGEATLVEEVLDAMPEAAALTHAGRVLHVNRVFTELFGYGQAECVGQELEELVVPEGHRHEREMMEHGLELGGRAVMETRRRARWGEEMDVCVLMAKVRLGGSAVGALVTYRDIRGQKREAARLRHTARHDGLTGLPNRAQFLEQVKLTLGRLKRRPDRGFAVVFLDLDGFKQVNDTRGHAAGDALLLVVAERLRRCLRPQDMVARFGGDEFALLLDESGDEAEVDAVAARLQMEMQREIEVNGVEAKVKASMGMVLATGDDADAEEMLRRADAAMYRAKAQGGGTQVFG